MEQSFGKWIPENQSKVTHNEHSAHSDEDEGQE